MTVQTVGVLILAVADTHLTAGRADRIIDVLGDRVERADLVVHAGDVTDPAVLDLLGERCELLAVAGNNDAIASLPERVEVTVGGVRLAMVHDSGASAGRDRRLAGWFPTADVVVFGHSHLPWNRTVETESGVQHHFNPGSPTQKRRAPDRTIGWIEVTPDGMITCSHEIVSPS